MIMANAKACSANAEENADTRLQLKPLLSLDEFCSAIDYDQGVAETDFLSHRYPGTAMRETNCADRQRFGWSLLC